MIDDLLNVEKQITDQRAHLLSANLEWGNLRIEVPNLKIIFFVASSSVYSTDPKLCKESRFDLIPQLFGGKLKPGKNARSCDRQF